MSKYLEAWRKAPEHKFKLVGNISLVEVIPDADFAKKVKTDSGETRTLYLSGHTSGRQVTDIVANKPTFCRILQAGEGHYKTNEDGSTEDVPPSYPIGSIVLVPSDSIRYISVLGKIVAHGETKLGLIEEGAVQGFATSLEEFEQYCEEKNKALG
jgi:hypothetical protein